MPAGPLILCSKSTWEPAIRREHALARCAAAAGQEVYFLERPLDVRALRSTAQRRQWLTAATGRAEPREQSGIRVVPTATFAPGHLSPAARSVETLRLRCDLVRTGRLAEATVVAMLPWHWPAVHSCGARRTVFDSADDWCALLPSHADEMARLYRRIGAQADIVVAVSAEMEARFGRHIKVVPNGADADLLAQPTATVARHGRRMVYVGTLSERFDVALADQVLEQMPGWTLDLYGQCQYAGHGDRPDSALEAFLECRRDRVRWHGAVRRADLVPAIDEATVAVVLHRRELMRGQDSMKLYDYASRARPIVSTAPLGPPDDQPPGGVRIAGEAHAFVRAVLEAADTPVGELSELRRWAERSGWPARWADWCRAVFGSDRVGTTVTATVES
jgi:glycosyltransferase involved in cell wall biosynthesis